ncbi:MAG: substrate-binding domain-containing protein [Granulosicoccus sp.]
MTIKKYLPIGLIAIAIGLTQSVPSYAAGSNRQALTTAHLRVCADPGNLPFSNKAEEGLENKVIELLAKELGKEVRYTWFPQSVGFVRNTLRLRQCDLISGITTTSEKVQNTNPYYHSAYAIVQSASVQPPIETMADERLRSLKLGVVAGTPPADILASQGMLGNLKPYHLVADTRRSSPASDAIDDVASGETDVAFIWGPIAGYFTRQSEVPLVVTPLLQEDSRVRMNYRVSMAVRFNETDWKRTVNAALAKIQPQIDEILHSYGVPLLNDRGELLPAP